MDFVTKLAAFLALLEREMNEEVKTNHLILHENAIKAGRRGYHHIGHEVGKRFIKVYTEHGQKSVRYFVDRETGVIFGAASWKKYNPNREYGTLDTINEWDWSDYYAVSKQGMGTLVPKDYRR